MPLSSVSSSPNHRNRLTFTSLSNPSDGQYTMCTCNDGNKYQYITPKIDAVETITEEGCDYHVRNAKTPTTRQPPQTAPPTPTISHPSPTSVNLGMATCIPDHNKGGIGSATWYMSLDTANKAIEEHCKEWNYIKWPVGPNQEKDSFSKKVEIKDWASPVGSETGSMYLNVKFIGGENCPVLDIGAKDKYSLCEDVYSTIVNTCDPDKDGQKLWKQGGRFERDCFQWSIAKHCDVGKEPDCIFGE
ncbi:hypothetical protein K469DRAFT_753595 [Zopfia rhizophila CBS 207.26]|uniref:Uncharacterized protein n=1 Tax=Zopfia rhizophila CBS 207.26 TaxID=1314779 RepID=A0A6A6DKU7_9PEZI|nr:hypothetical protein K469DRAFT_753595 [Zopfia rhizophila CBS 207.26]